MTPTQLSIAFFLQVAVILVTCRLVGTAAQRWFGQPRVVGEMIAGVLLGPSLFGALAPEVQAFLFPKESKPILFVIAQFGVGLYMFLVGLGFDRDEFFRGVKGAASVSLAGMAAPFGVAVAIAPWLLGHGGLFTPKVTQFEATLFMGAAIAITAFPMLARIIHERGLSGTPLGTLSLSAGAIDDAGAWVLIALVLASFGDGPQVAVLAIGGGLAFALFMVLLAPRLLRGLSARAEQGGLDESLLALVLVLFLLSAWAMDAVGIHAVFGGFLLGTAMPRGKLAAAIREKLEPVTVVLLLPFFFTYSGLHTELTLLADPALLAVAALILVLSIAAKGGACYLAARLSGQDHATASGIGALMNARGLMELIVINIGLQRGIITPALFSMLVVMAIVTTLMASPLFEALYGRRARAEGRL
ncbi:cation:proton antiporter [Novosphingobium sp. APW14]|uniref:cation:proton antiporter n=1 Tax=Novosphingobium sp. APW14 TaxID=3077237 RepID=UPI0028E0535E|nr:cation:proton antiporter [Novosphingobium sp. APW14]MDT9012620.1 cation:proton antiporter [Novosphingobium sp. APW14]